MTAQQLPEGFDEQRVRSHIAESHANLEELQRASDSLLAGHEGEWATAHHGQFLFGSSIEDVLAKARQAQWPLDVIAIRHLTRTRPAVLL